MCKSSSQTVAGGLQLVSRKFLDELLDFSVHFVIHIFSRLLPTLMHFTTAERPLLIIVLKGIDVGDPVAGG